MTRLTKKYQNTERLIADARYTNRETRGAAEMVRVIAAYNLVTYKPVMDSETLRS